MTRWVYIDASVGMELCYDPMRQFHVMNFAVTDLLGPQRSSRAGQWLQSRRDAKRIAQDERGTSAVLGEDAQNELLLPFFVIGVPARRLARQSRKREEEMWWSRYPGRRPRRPCPGLFSCRPSRGSRDRHRFIRQSCHEFIAEQSANQSVEPTAGSALFLSLSPSAHMGYCPAVAHADR